jgi:hypothetical protein
MDEAISWARRLDVIFHSHQVDFCLHALCSQRSFQVFQPVLP